MYVLNDHNTNYEINNFTLCLGKKKVLDNISFKLKPGCITAILGANGSGKSTLLNHLAITNFQYSKNDKRNLSYVAQKDYLDPYDTVSGQFKFQAQLDGIKLSKDCILRSKIFLALGLDKIWSQRINSLSGGQKRAVALGLAFIKNPKFILLDEPTSSLDIDVRNKFWNAVIDYKKDNNVTLLVATHNMWEVEHFADNILVINEGKLLCSLNKYKFSNMVNGHVITIDIPKVNDLQEKVQMGISATLPNLTLLNLGENNIRYINNHTYNIDDVFNELKFIISEQSGSNARISVNSASLEDCYYYVLEKKTGCTYDIEV